MGTRYEQCFDCKKTYARALNQLVPICYSLDSQMESALWRAKNDPAHRWLHLPLASLLHSYINEHLVCIEARFGTFDLFTTVPSHPSTRGGHDHLRELLACVDDWPRKWEPNVLIKTAVGRADLHRNKIQPDLFATASGGRLVDAHVLVLDDTYTSGSTVASAAYALKVAGARTVVAVTLGRQLRREWPWASELIESLRARSLDLATCAIHRN